MKKVAYCPKCQGLMKTMRTSETFPKELFFCEACNNFFQIMFYEGKNLRCPKCKSYVEQTGSFYYHCKACDIGFTFAELEAFKRWCCR